MDINFPLVLLILVVVTGVIWALDKWVLSPARDTDERQPKWVEYTGGFFPVLFIVFVLRSFLFEPFQIPSGSMIPTLKVGDFILVNKFTYGIRLPVVRTKILSINEPKRGDVMVFFPPNESRYFIKRVVGLPGDSIRVVDNQLFVNGKAAQQVENGELPDDPRYAIRMENLEGVNHLIQKGKYPGPFGKNYSTTVPEGHYFMMGDNRDNSSDSRDWGPVPEERIVGKAVLVWMHWAKGMPSFSSVGAIN